MKEYLLFHGKTTPPKILFLTDIQEDTIEPKAGSPEHSHSQTKTWGWAQKSFTLFPGNRKAEYRNR